VGDGLRESERRLRNAASIISRGGAAASRPGAGSVNGTQLVAPRRVWPSESRSGFPTANRRRTPLVRSGVGDRIGRLVWEADARAVLRARRASRPNHPCSEKLQRDAGHAARARAGLPNLPTGANRERNKSRAETRSEATACERNRIRALQLRASLGASVPSGNGHVFRSGALQGERRKRGCLFCETISCATRLAGSHQFRVHCDRALHFCRDEDPLNFCRNDVAFAGLWD
jgi:hypothetical protein